MQRIQWNPCRKSIWHYGRILIIDLTNKGVSYVNNIKYNIMNDRIVTGTMTTRGETNKFNKINIIFKNGSSVLFGERLAFV